MVRIPDDDLTIGPPSPMSGLGESGADRHADMTAAASSRFAPGAIIAGRYRLVALLGRAAWARFIGPTISRSISRSR